MELDAGDPWPSVLSLPWHIAASKYAYTWGSLFSFSFASALIRKDLCHERAKYTGIYSVGVGGHDRGAGGVLGGRSIWAA
jgi:hypothetical protein